VEARLAIIKFLEHEHTRNYSQTITVPGTAIPMLIGVKGANIREIQEATGARVEFDKLTGKGIIRGSPEDCTKACEMITEILDREGFSNLPVAVEPEKAVEDLSDNDSEEGNKESGRGNQKLPPGLNPDAAKKAAAKSMSKSALRRKRRKDKTGTDNGDNTEVENSLARETSEEGVGNNHASLSMDASDSQIEIPAENQGASLGTEEDDEGEKQTLLSSSPLSNHGPAKGSFSVDESFINASLDSLGNEVANSLSLSDPIVTPGEVETQVHEILKSQSPGVALKISESPVTNSGAVLQDSSRLLNVLLGRSSGGNASHKLEPNAAESSEQQNMESLGLGYNYGNLPYFSNANHNYIANPPPGLTRTSPGLMGLPAAVPSGMSNIYSNSSAFSGSGMMMSDGRAMNSVFPSSQGAFGSMDSFANGIPYGLHAHPPAAASNAPYRYLNGGDDLADPNARGTPSSTQPKVSAPANAGQQLPSEKHQNSYFKSKSGFAVRL